MNSIKINKDDMVAVALAPLKKDDLIEIGGETVRLLDDIPKAHKFALRDIAGRRTGDQVRELYRVATSVIKKGQWVHDHNESSGEDEGYRKEYVYSFDRVERAICPEAPKIPSWAMNEKTDRPASGIKLAVIPTVSCVNGPAAEDCMPWRQKNTRDPNILTELFPCLIRTAAVRRGRIWRQRERSSQA
jgi:altronate hydrolase